MMTDKEYLDYWLKFNKYKFKRDSKFKQIIKRIMSTKEVGFVKKKYSELLKMGAKVLDDMKIPFEVRKAEKDLEKEIIVLEQEIAEQELKIQDAKSSRPINLRTILDAIDSKDLKERDLKLANELQKELF